MKWKEGGAIRKTYTNVRVLKELRQPNMDVCMIDITDIPCREGDGVEIFGPQLPVTQLAEWLGTIPYEVMTGISTRVRRVYTVEG